MSGQYLNYGRNLITAKRLDRALEVFNANQKKNGDVFQVNADLCHIILQKEIFKKHWNMQTRHWPRP
jgi:hypothetical protein